jgi:co-chaperonin GroES (HSP10)
MSELATQLPVPTGYRMLCALPDVEEKFQNGIFKPEAMRQLEEFSTVVLFVIKQGPDCYKDKDKFPTGPWCAEGDFVLVRAFCGTRFKIHGKEFRLINDDTIEGVVQDPRGYTRA